MRMRLTFILSALCTLGGAVAFIFFSHGRPEGFLAVLLVLAVEAGLYWLLFRPFLRTETVLEHGELAEATVLKVWDTGWTINDDPQVGLQLEVRPAGDMPFQAETKSVIPRLLVADARPGSVIQVRFDPRNRRNLAVVPEPAVKRGPGGAAARLAELEDLRQRGLVTEEEYEHKREEILDAV